MFPDAQQILDYFHLCENVHTFAKYMFKMDDKKAKAWAADVCIKLRASKTDLVLRELEPCKDKKPDGCPVNLYGYISNNI